MSKNKPIKQHYISKFYLKRFFCPEISQNMGLDEEKRKIENKKHRFQFYAYPEFEGNHMKNPVGLHFDSTAGLNSESNIFKNNCFEKYFYSDEEDLNKEDCLEHLIDGKENVWSDMIDNINVNNNIDLYRKELIEFVFLNGIKSLYTNKYMIEYGKHYFNICKKRAMSILMNIGFDLFNIDSFEIASKDKEFFFEEEIIKSQRNTLKMLFQNEIDNKKWNINICDSEINIVLNDSPFLCLNFDGQLTRNFEPDNCNCIMYPLNYKKMIILYEDINIVNEQDLIKKYNEYFIFNYYRFLWSKDEQLIHKKVDCLKNLHHVPLEEILTEKLINNYMNFLQENKKLTKNRIIREKNKGMINTVDEYILLKNDILFYNKTWNYCYDEYDVIVLPITYDFNKNKSFFYKAKTLIILN